jgi:hypothetical protein
MINSTVRNGEGDLLMYRKSCHSSTVDFYPVEWPERVELGLSRMTQSGQQEMFA